MGVILLVSMTPVKAAGRSGQDPNGCGVTQV
jgi:hypothetical protein